VAKKPDFSGLKKTKPPAEVIAFGDLKPSAAPEPDKPDWQRGARPSTMWFNIEQMHRLKEIGYSEQRSVRELLFDAINLLLPEKGHLVVDPENPMNRGYEAPAKKDR
jgi:hypothetical protein